MVYDVKEYAPEHPGGDHYIMDNLGTNIEDLFEEHEHTKAARKTLLKLPKIGVMADGADDNSSSSSLTLKK